MKKTWKRMLSIVLTAAMLCSMAGMDTVSAAQADTTATSSGTLPDSVPEGVTPSGEDLTLPDTLAIDGKPVIDSTVSGATLPASTLMMRSQSNEPGTYSEADVAVINAIIDNNGLNWTKADPADGSDIPEDWKNDVTWSTSGTEKRITRLNVSEKGLTGSLDVSGLSWLERLYCNKNKLTGLPALPNSLTYLDCSENKLTRLPALPNSLTYLRCSKNDLTELPTLPTLSSRIELYCSDNELTELPTLPNSLKVLECRDNDLTELPTLPEGLIRLECSYNELTELPALPNSLEALSCSGDGLTELPTLPNSLKVLECSDNELTELPALPDGLKNLFCHYNKLTGLSLNSNAEYTYIDVRHNYMTDENAVTGQTPPWDGDKLKFEPQNAESFVPVRGITDGPVVAVVDIPLTLTAKVVPAKATNQDIQWSLSTWDPNTTNASVENGVFKATTAGEATVDVLIPDGKAIDIPYGDFFSITVIEEFSTVTLNPDTTTVEKGKSQRFSAALDKVDSESEYFNWSVDSAAGSTISAGGVLKVSANETAKTLTVTATFKGDITESATAVVSVPQAVTVTGGTASPTTAVQGAAVTITAGTPPTGKQFKEWSITPAVTFVNGTGRTSSTAKFTMPAQAVSATAVYEDQPASTDSGQKGGNGGGSGSSSPAVSQPAITGKQPNMPAIGEVSVTGTVTKQALAVTVSDQTIKDAIKAAQDAARKAGKAKDGIAVVLPISSSTSYESLSLTLSRESLDALKNASVKSLTIGSPVIDLRLNQKAIEAVHSQTTGSVTVSITAQHKLSADAKGWIGSRPVFDITIRDSEGVTVSDLKGGIATIGIAYQPTGGEKTGNLCAVYVDVNGKPELLPHSSYTDGRLIFSRASLSVYGVSYKTPAPAFTDTVNHWAKDYMDFAASRGYLTGTSASKFSPDAGITRKDFLMALGKLSGADVSSYKTSSFTDVANTDPAMPYIEWAVINGIAKDIGSNQFAPNGLITREQIAVMMTGYAKAVRYPLPVSRQTVTFADHMEISSWAKDAVKALQQTGVISSKQDNLFAPQENATRAEASAILHRFVELVIDEGTARGWVQNDAGQWQYINADGRLAVNTTIDGYKVLEDGTRK